MTDELIEKAPDIAERTPTRREGLVVTSQRPGGFDRGIISSDRLVTFLYILMRDHLTPGVLESVLTGHVESPEGEVHFCDDFLAARAVEMSARLHGLTPISAHEHAHGVLRNALDRGK